MRGRAAQLTSNWLSITLGTLVASRHPGEVHRGGVPPRELGGSPWGRLPAPARAKRGHPGETRADTRWPAPGRARGECCCVRSAPTPGGRLFWGCAPWWRQSKDFCKRADFGSSSGDFCKPPETGKKSTPPSRGRPPVVGGRRAGAWQAASTPGALPGQNAGRPVCHARAGGEPALRRASAAPRGSGRHERALHHVRAQGDAPSPRDESSPCTRGRQGGESAQGARPRYGARGEHAPTPWAP